MDVYFSADSDDQVGERDVVTHGGVEVTFVSSDVLLTGNMVSILPRKGRSKKLILFLKYF